MIGTYFLIVNVVAFLAYAIDKQKAIHGKWRIRESVLLGLALIGGSVGALLGMHICHHKTRKAYFAFGVPAMLILQIALACYIYF